MSCLVLNPARAIVVIGFALGSLLRLLPVFTGDFPTGDGGLILAMVEDIRRAGLAIPLTSSYNHLDIPFVYPPLALWLFAAVGALTGASTVDVLRIAAPLLATASLVLFGVLARRLMRPLAAAMALLVYALMPSAFDALSAGGGLTRSAGLVLALGGVAIAAREGGRPLVRGALVGVVLGIAFLAHPQAGAFGVMAAIVLTATRDARWVSSGLAAAGAAILVLAPWLALVAGRDQFGALVGAGQRLEPVVGLIRLMNLEFSGAIFADIFAVAGMLGLVVAIATGAWRLPLLLIGTYVMGAGAAGFLGAVPWALLAGVGAAFAAQWIGAAAASRRLSLARVGLAITLLFVGLVATLGAGAGTSSKLHRLTGPQLEAMRWIERNTPADASFVLATTVVWGDDELTEWFPALTTRHSLATVQGSEWLGRPAFERQLRRHFDVLACARATADCIGVLAQDYAAGPAYVMVPKGRLGGAFSPEDCCPAMRSTLEAAGLEVVYDGPGATIGRVRDS